MRRYYFYTAPSALDSQTLGQEFGPAQTGVPGATDGSQFDKYQITNLHTAGTEAPAFAVCNGTICVQEDDSGTYSIILKPDYQPPFDFPFIKYFLYKGISPASLVSGSGTNSSVDFSKKGDTPFIERIHDSWEPEIPNGTNSVADSAEVLGLVYEAGASFLISGTSRRISEDTDPIDNLFYYPNDDFPLPRVNAGEKIGLFDGGGLGFGFEIILERLGYAPTLEFARTKVNYIRVPAIANPHNDSPAGQWAADDADYFLHWHEKEACLNYMDPCAFYGAFCGGKVFSSTGAGGSTRHRKEEVYDEVLVKAGFLNKNKIYLDLRNDYGYSLNYYKDYGERIAFSGKDATVTPVELTTTADRWPLCTVELGDIETVGKILRDKFFRTNLSLPNGDISKPLVYLSKAYVKNFRKLKRKQRVQWPSATLGTDFLEPIDLTFITTDSGASPAFVANYYRINLYDENRSNTTASTSLAPAKDYYLNGLFRPQDMQQSLAIRNNNFRFTIWHEELLVDQTEYGGQQFIAQVGIAEDEYNITLFAFPVYYTKTLSRKNRLNSSIGWTAKSKTSTNMFLQHAFNIDPSKNLSIQEVKNIDPISHIDNIVETVFVEPVHEYNRNHNFKFKDDPENYVFIIFEKTEFRNYVIDMENQILVYSAASAFLQCKTIYDSNSQDTDFMDFDVSLILRNSNSIRRVLANYGDGVYRFVGPGLSAMEKEIVWKPDITEKNISQYFKRIEINPSTTSGHWNLVDSNYRPQLYDFDESDCFGNEIDDTPIKLHAGTRVMVLGENKEKTHAYITCFYNGNFREGLIDAAAISTSSCRKEINSDLSNSAIAISFVNDAKYIIDYCRRVDRDKLVGEFNQIVNVCEEHLKNLLSLDLNTIASKIKALSVVLKDKDIDKSLLYDISDKIKTIDRYEEHFSSLKTMLEVNGGRALSQEQYESKVLTPLNSLVIPFSPNWILKEATTPASLELKKYLIDNGIWVASSDGIEINSGDADSGEVLTLDSNPDEFKYITEALLKIKADYSTSPESSIKRWLDKLDTNTFTRRPDGITMLIFLQSGTWYNKDGSKPDDLNLFQSDILVDSSIGFINNPSLLSVIIHEINTYSEAATPQSEMCTEKRFLHFDTHAVDAHIDIINNQLIPMAKKGRIINFFDAMDFEAHTSSGSGPFGMGTQPQISVLYLNHYLETMKNI